MRRFLPFGTGHDSTLWPVLLLLLIVLVPSAGVVWMMRAAMDNERLAVRQRLADAYRTQLEIAKGRVDDHWQTQLARLDAIAAEEEPPKAFAECVAAGVCDSVVILDGDGKVAYPAAASPGMATEERNHPAWARAERKEFLEHDLAGAAQAYQAIADGTTSAGIAARARQAQARALLGAGDRSGAIAVLGEIRDDNSARDAQGRLLAADAELHMLELLDKDSPEYAKVAASLTNRLNDYNSSFLPSDQRRFLARSTASLNAANALGSMLAAEDLAAEFVDGPRESVPSRDVHGTEMPDVFQMRSPSGRVIALFMASSLKRTVEQALAEQPFSEGAIVEAQGPSPGDAGEDFATVSLAPTMPGWRLSLRLADAQSFDAAANERVAFFVWTAVVLVAITAALALLVANVLVRQRRLTRLKNDLVATVSHELKTPLASIRLLVDTLLDAEESADSPFGDRARARQYLEMIAQENTRLSRLIDNFLTFSRMERGKHRFDFQPTDAANIVEQAVAAVADRFEAAGAKLRIDVERSLPLTGDVDALVTVVVNLLDNAWKYTGESKCVAVSARREGDRVAIAVEDNGIGLSPRAVRRVFDRFYQVDERLSRSQGGCGLGLSIVKYIVEAHGGSVAAESRVGEGSKFTVLLPADRT